MIKANELRIGNLVHSTVWVTDVIVDIDNIGYYEDFIPIQITDEYLLKFGFERYNNNFQIKTLHGLKTKKPSTIAIKHTEDCNFVVLRPANRTIYLHSIHQLQNLYFALTGQELTVKE